MASGKSTLGRALAARLGRRFVDLDRQIEDRTAMTVAEIFATHGQEHFRRLESELLRTAAPGDIVACGGGTPLAGDNMQWMLDNGLTVWIQAGIPRTIERLKLTPGVRPLVDKLLDSPDQLRQYVAELLSQRSPVYSRAHKTFDGERLENSQQIDQSVSTFITTLLQ